MSNLVLSNLGKALRTIKRDSYEIWFNRWFEHNDFPKILEILAKKGYSGYSIDVTKFDDYSKRRLSDNRMLGLLKKNLPGIKIEREQGSFVKSFLGVRHKVEYNRIIFSWDDEKTIFRSE